jgi:hypothetical protein
MNVDCQKAINKGSTNFYAVAFFRDTFGLGVTAQTLSSTVLLFSNLS